jgi:hypothetical protein
MQQFTGILTRATGAIAEAYFRLQVDGGDPVYRERVYCYELYHQMRVQWPRHSEYYLNGEIDKAAHPILMELGAAGAKPDLLVHRPGYMVGNYAIIEVKKSDAANGAIRIDLAKLSLFVRRVRYQRAIYLIYGEDADDQLLQRVRDVAATMPELAPTELWLHQRPGVRATCAAVIEPAAAPAA